MCDSNNSVVDFFRTYVFDGSFNFVNVIILHHYRESKLETIKNIFRNLEYYFNNSFYIC